MRTAIRITRECDSSTDEDVGAGVRAANVQENSRLLLLTVMEQGDDLAFENGGLGGSDVLAVDAAIPPDHECDRQSEDATIEFTNARISHHDGIVDLELLCKRAHRIDRVIHRDANDLQALASVLLLKFDKVRNFFAARLAPRRPEVQQDNLAAQR